MAYGRLDVFWPDGKFESHLLENPTVSVGRAAGNTIALDTTTVSRYHFSVTQEHGQVVLADLDSENGTFIDGVRVTQPITLDGVAEIQVGQLRMIFQPVDDEPTLPVAPALDVDTQRIERAEAQLRVDIETTRLDVWPASNGVVELSITNTAEERRQFLLKVTGIPEEWVNLSQNQLDVGPDVTVYALVQVTPPRRPDVRPMTYQAAVQVIPVEAPAGSVEAALDVTVHGYGGFGVALEPDVLDADGAFRLYVQNQGNEVLPITMRALAVAAPLNFVLPTAPLELAAGQSLQVNGRALPRQRPLTGTPTQAPFHVLIQAQTAAAFTTVVEGKATITPLVPLWGVITAGGIAISVLLLVLLALFGAFTPPPQPAILSFTVNNTQIAQGEPLLLAWQTFDAETIYVYVDDTRMAELTADTTRYELPTDGLVGRVSVEIEAANRGYTSRIGRELLVYEPMQVQQFEVEPTRLVRNVVSNLSLTWDVSNAVSTQIIGLQDFTNAPVQANAGAQGQIENVVGIPEQPLEITLRARDAVDNVLEETRRIELIDPQCEATQTIQLREGPGEQYQVLSTVMAGGNMVVNAQDAASGWLRVELPISISAWGPSASFDCADTFNLNDLRKDVPIPPLPLPSPSPQPTPTPPLDVQES